MTTAAVHLITLPNIITAPGRYLTRAGEIVTINEVETVPGTDYPRAGVFGCHGTYPCGTPERWHRSGRIFFGLETPNDIVSAA